MSETPSDAHYVDRKAASQSYRPKSGLMSDGLKRAREPFRFRNAITGIALGAFGVGVWAYSISAVRQDVFDDVDEEVEAMRKSGQAPAAQNITPLPAHAPTSVASPALATTTETISAPATASAGTVPETRPAAPRRGLLQYMDNRLPGLLHPQSKTLVWNAPPVDNIGKLGRP